MQLLIRACVKLTRHLNNNNYELATRTPIGSTVTMSSERRTRVNCFICHSAAGNAFADVVRHIGYVHAHDPNFNVVCGIEGCPRSYHNFLSYKRHLYRDHRYPLNLVCEETNGGGASLDDLDQDDIPEAVTTAAVGATALMESDRQLRQNRAALFILKTSEVHRLPLATMESLLPDIAALVQHATLQIQEKLLEALATESITDSTIREICQYDAISNPFSGMETTYQHTQYFKAHLNMIVRHAYTLVHWSMIIIWCSYRSPMKDSESGCNR